MVVQTPRTFLTIAKSLEARTSVKASEFISTCSRVSTIQDALDFIESIRTKYPDATHNCWAYRLSPNEYRFSDDGEPGGTAGQPILQAISGAELEEVCVVVTRYFGGVKLGAGGLVRAYGGAAASLLKEAGCIVIKPKVTLVVEVPFSEQNALYRFLDIHTNISYTPPSYTPKGLSIELTIYLEDQQQIESELTDFLRGKVEIMLISHVE